MNELEKRDNGRQYDFQDLLNLQGKTLEGVNNLAAAIGTIVKNQDTMSDQISNLQDNQNKGNERMSKLERRMTNVEENEEITYSQQQNIRSAVNTRVYVLLNVPRKKDERTLADKITLRKYSTLFHRRCYVEVGQKGHLRDPYRTTLKKNYDDAMRDITEWFPRDGIDMLKREADENALARKIAKEQGYTDE